MNQENDFKISGSIKSQAVGKPSAQHRHHIGWAWSIIVPILLSTGCTTYWSWGEETASPLLESQRSMREARIDGDRYRVRGGDVLGLIAQLSDVPLVTLAAVNEIEPPYLIYPGDVLDIPRNTTTLARRPSRKAAQPPRPELVSTSPIEGELYLVRPGESLSAIAKRHDLGVGDLVAVNGIGPPYNIFPGQSLIIPPSEEALMQQAKTRMTELDQKATAAALPPLNPKGFLWPIHGRMIRSFDQNQASGHGGTVNIAAHEGTPVRAANDGLVVYAGEAVPHYGRMIILGHADGYLTLYAHNDILLADEGAFVHRGQPIAEVGDSGDVDADQLLFELRRGSKPIDPGTLLGDMPGLLIGVQP